MGNSEIITMKEKINEELDRLTRKFYERMLKSKSEVERNRWFSFINGISAAWAVIECIEEQKDAPDDKTN